MWVERVPRPLDFCGRPGCPQCYDWQEDGRACRGLDHMALELLGLAYQQCLQTDKLALDAAAQRIHTGAVAEEVPAAVDIGMPDQVALEGWLKQQQIQTVAPTTRVLTVDEIADRMEARQKALDAKQAVWQERKQELNALADALLTAEREAKERARGQEEVMLRQLVPERFIYECRVGRGIQDPAAIINLWNQTEPRASYLNFPLTPTFVVPTKYPGAKDS